MSHPEPHLAFETPKDFWEERYAQSTARQRGKAGRILQDKIQGLTPQRVLELGCSNGDDSLWLAEQGWQVTAVDISEHAIQTAQRLAHEAGLADRIQFSARDLSLDFPEGQFELVCAMFFQSPYDDFPRIEILKTAAARIVAGGHLLIVTHATGLPWAKHGPKEHVFPKAQEDWQDLALGDDWQLLELSVPARIATGPDGQQAEVKDNLIWARRL